MKTDGNANERSHLSAAVLGAGPAGLTTALALQRSGRVTVRVAERERVVGGLTRTIVDGDFRFDLGGHRFYTKDPATEAFVRGLLGDDLLAVSRLSRIHFRDRFVDYPVRPINALRKLGFGTACKIMRDLARVSLRKRDDTPLRSLEDCMVASYGRTLFETYFKEYAEKVCGLAANDICADLAAQRVKGLDLLSTLRHALFPRSRAAVESMVEEFLYPRFGYGEICKSMQRELPREALDLETEPVRIAHEHGRVTRIETTRASGRESWSPDEVVSTIPLPALVKLFDPAPPAAVIASANSLGFRAVVFAAVFVDRPSVRPESWIYFPSSKISFGRIVEPRNWSTEMSPPGATSIVAEHFCNVGDSVWRSTDEAIVERTVHDLTDVLGFFARRDVLGTRVVRVPFAYPRMDVAHREHVSVLTNYLDQFENLQVVGRNGMYRYHNTDHVIETGLAAAARILGDSTADPRIVNTELTYHERRKTACSRVSS